MTKKWKRASEALFFWECDMW